MESCSEDEGNKSTGCDQSEAPKKPKRQMKTPFQLETLERTYASEAYPSEATRAELSEKLGLTDRQLQMWFCHRRLKKKKDTAAKSAQPPVAVERKGKEQLMLADPGSDRGSRSRSVSGSRSASGSGSRSSQCGYSDDVPLESMRCYESTRSALESRVRACIEEQLGEPIREDGPILGVEFDALPPGAFGAPIVMSQHREWSRRSYDGKVFDRYDTKPIKAPASAFHESVNPIIGSDAYGGISSSHFPGPRSLSLMQGNGQLPIKRPGGQFHVSNVSVHSEKVSQRQLSSPLRDNNDVVHNENIVQIGKKRKNDELRIGREAQINEKRVRKELEKQELLKRKREDQMKKETEKQERERRKEEERMVREKQRQEEKFQREERREIERREKFMQKELLRAEKRKQKEEVRREKEAVRLRAALEKATARRIAKESTELIEDERLELMELAASSKSFPSILSLDYDTLQNLEAFRDALCIFPPESVKLKKPFAVQPWIDSDENVGNLCMAWRFLITFADVLGLWPFTLDEFVQAFHDYESRLLGEVHIALMKLIMRDIEDVARMPAGGPGTNQYTATSPDGGHPRIVEGAYLWGFDIFNWKSHLNPLTWPEILRQLALSAGFGPRLNKKITEKAGLPDDNEGKGCEDVISTLRDGSAVENAIAVMQEKGFSLNRKSRHRLTPGTVKFAAYHVLSLEGGEGINVVELADKIQKSGLRDLTTSKTPEASISVALSRDPVLFERTAPSTYCVRPTFRKDPANADAVLAAAREKMQIYLTGVLAGENAADVERDDESDSDVEGAQVDDLIAPSDVNLNDNNGTEIATCPVNGKDELSENVALYVENEFNNTGPASKSNQKKETDIDESKSGEPWVQGLTEGEYSHLSVEERLNALVALIGLANEGNTIRTVLEDRMDAANALKKQMWAEAQLDKRRLKEDNVNKFNDSSLIVGADGSQSPLVNADNKICEASASMPVKGEPSSGVDGVQDYADLVPAEKSPSEHDSKSQITAFVQPNGHTAERSRLQLKSFIGHRAEETYVYRSLPLGQDRRRNRYWQFVASASRNDPGSGRIFVESPDGCWRLIDSEEAFDAIMSSLDTRGIRESHLHIMLQKVEKSFKDTASSVQCAYHVEQRENTFESEVGEFSSGSTGGIESPASAVFGLSSDASECSSSFLIEFGKNEAEKKNALKRYLDLQIWMWKECLNSSTLCAIAFGKLRCMPLLGFCDSCLLSYIFEGSLCPTCHKEFRVSEGKSNLLDQIMQGEEKSKINLNYLHATDSSHPPRITLLKAFLTVVEMSVPSDVLQSSWERQRKNWGLRLHNSLSMEDLLQILTQFEGVIRREYLSSNFETTEELLESFVSTEKSSSDCAYPGLVPQLPWIPQTTAAVSLRLLDLDASISYTLNQKTETVSELKMEEDATRFLSTRVRMKNIGKVLSMNKQRTGGNSNWARPSKMKKVIRGNGGRRSRFKGHKKVAGSISSSGRKKVQGGETLSQFLLQQGQRVNLQKYARGRRTVRKRRTENKAVGQTLIGQVSGEVNTRGTRDSPEDEDQFGEGSDKMQVEEDDYSKSLDSADSNDSNRSSRFECKLQSDLQEDYNGRGRDVDEDGDEVSDENNDSMDEDEEDVEDDEEGGAEDFEEEGRRNVEEDVDMDDGSDENEDESSESMASGD